MNQDIVKLPAEVTNQIAAGEVVERPASVVKELIENSLDAGADRIEVEFAGGGVEKMEVSDDGQGMSGEELPRAVLKHTTSKITSVDELEQVGTLGFRGEALASIASVADLEIVSRSQGTPEGNRLVKSPGESPEVRPAPRKPGTTVTVTNLFETVPARRKFLATRSTEKKHILRTVQQKILGHPDVHFVLRERENEVLNVPPGELDERVAATLGEETADHLLPLDRLDPDWKGLGRFTLTGLISDGEIVHHSRRHQFFFVNSRPVREPIFYRAISQAYGDLVLPDRHPVAVLFFRLPREELDVNVHPRKEEVRFNSSQAVYKFLDESLTETLEQHFQDQVEGAGAGEKKGPDQGGIPDFTGKQVSPEQAEKAERSDQTELFSPEGERVEASGARVIGQFRRLFLLVERGTGLLFVDQHNAHERILFERYLSQVEDRDPAQYLSVPIRMDVSPADRETLKTHRKQLGHLGLEIESFGGGSMVIQAVPGYLGRRSEDRKIIFEMIEEFLETDREGELSEPRKDMLSIMACRSALKRGEHLMPREQEELVEGLSGLDFPKLCPHGRPVFYEVENEKMASWVGRPLGDLEPR